MSLTHEDLRVAAIKFAKRQGYDYRRGEYVKGLRLTTIASEAVTAANDIPDVIGWDATHSCVIECKASRADFLRDAKKPQRNSGTGMGVCRYYFAPKGMIDKSELPEGWGLIEVEGNDMAVSVQSPQRTLDAAGHMHEKRILLSLIRRVRMREFLIIQKDDELASVSTSQPQSL